MKMKHNKKRNTAFLYETLVRELTTCVVNADHKRKSKIVSIMKEFFKRDTALGTELELYRTLYETTDVDPLTSEKLLLEVKRVYQGLSQEEVFVQQSELIGTINRELGKGTFSNFVPNYKDLATISQIFDAKTTIKRRTLLEKKVLDSMSSSKQEVVQESLKPVDNLVYTTFVKKFNEQYSGTLREEQNKLLSSYIVSFSDNGVSLKMFMNEEIARLKTVVEDSLQLNEVASDEMMVEKTQKVLKTLDSFAEKQIDRAMLKKLLKIQELAAEIGN
tara:strand:- start:783 stop:1607 length:825 start_codon:yes stop_codon:yes gene_type:complete